MFRQAAIMIILPLMIQASPAMAAEEEVAVLETPHGGIVWRFFEQEAPGHAAYVKELIRRGFYDGTKIHRVLPHFVIQGGDPNSKNADRSDDGSGEADRRLEAEFSENLHYRPGTVGMARDADPDSGSCQFFIALENIPRLDGRYSIFGEVIEGLEVAREIASQPRDLNDNPLAPIPVTARLEKRRVPDTFLSGEPGPAGETITGLARPKMYDPGNKLWSRLEVVEKEDLPATVRLDLIVQEDGTVQDVRFVDWRTPDAGRLAKAAAGWRFTPPRLDGKPRKVRLEIDGNGSNPGAPTNDYAPREITQGVMPPRPAVRVELPAGKEAPGKTASIRLTIGGSGQVSEAWLQESCGDAALDEAALAEAKKLVFKPATRPDPATGEPGPVSVYLNVEAVFVPAQVERPTATQ